ncbi:unnamed protein product [Rodentolepis nana]|uniref:BHLH domain-containing protein n=1 Tax=Rodentolepis nana TaxID=102285 RepID=A0A0R3T7E6_RODNA|nr:unnamed protein product [Rodentolepis nana]
MSLQARALHLGRINGQRQSRLASIAHLDRTITSLRQLVPPSTNKPTPKTVNTLDDMETLLEDAIVFLSKIAEEPELVRAIRAEYASRQNVLVPSNNSTENHSVQNHSSSNSHSSPPSPPRDMENLFTLFKLKRGLGQKRLIPRRI